MFGVSIQLRPVRADRLIGMVVAHDEQDVRPLGAAISRRSREQASEEQEADCGLRIAGLRIEERQF